LIEHPKLAVERLAHFAGLMGRKRLMTWIDGGRVTAVDGTFVDSVRS
jgi:hypothetical protein